MKHLLFALSIVFFIVSCDNGSATVDTKIPVEFRGNFETVSYESVYNGEIFNLPLTDSWGAITIFTGGYEIGDTWVRVFRNGKLLDSYDIELVGNNIVSNGYINAATIAQTIHQVLFSDRDTLYIHTTDRKERNERVSVFSWNNNRLIGTWVNNDEGHRVVFTADRAVRYSSLTGTSVMWNGQFYWSGQYIYNSDYITLYISFSGGGRKEVFPYTIDGNTLILDGMHWSKK